MSFQIEFKTFLGAIEHQFVAEQEAASFLRKHENLGAQLISVTAPNGDRWMGSEAYQRIANASC